MSNRKSLVHKMEEHEKSLSGHGVYIDEANCYIYRLAVAPDGWCRVCQNHFDIQNNTVLGQPRQVWDYKTPAEALTAFNNLKLMPHRNIWREDERVFYSAEDYWNKAKQWKDGRNRYELMLSGKESWCVLYYNPKDGYYVKAYISGGCVDEMLHATTLDTAKKEAEA